MSIQDDTFTMNLVYKNDQNDPDISDDMRQVATYLNDYISPEHIKWIRESEAIDLVSAGDLTTKDVFVLQEFEGQIFEDLKTTSALIVGPRCLLVCLLDCTEIPNTKTPVYITAMRDLYICCSGFDIAQKTKMKNLISYMGGYYLTELNKQCHYLISNTIKSNKYEQAVINSIPVMQSEWVDAVWKAGKTKTILATDTIFEKYKLQIFYGAKITVSGLSHTQKEEIMKLVIDNGGDFHKSFKSSSTDILIITNNGVNSEKYKAAMRFKKDILLPEWIYDSVEHGFALPFKSYVVKSLKNSTPTKTGNSSVDFIPANCTQISGINLTNADVTTNIDETICSVNSSAKRQTRATSSLGKSKEKENYQRILSEISPQHAKKAGTFLDGCCIYLSGFTTDEKEKLNKILNVGGATRYNEFNDKITHIIVGEVIASELATWREQQLGASIVTLDWLVESIKLKQPANELNYPAKLPIPREPEAPSPQTKKTLHSMNNSFKKPDLPKKRLNFINNNASVNNLENDCENDFLTHYSQENNMSNANITLSDLPRAPKSVKLKEFQKMKTKETKIPSIAKLPLVSANYLTNEYTTNNLTNEYSMSTEQFENLNFFEGLTVFIDRNYDQEYLSQTVIDCETAGGKVVTSTYRDLVDYVIVSSSMPVDINSIPVRTKNIVNNIWLDDAIRYNKLVNIEYYHKPISIMAGNKPLTNLTVVISAYSLNERQFIQILVTILGAKSKDQYDRKDKPILVCYSTTTEKYDAALKWNYPVVKSEWLVKCSETGIMEPMEPYLVGNAKVADYFTQLYNGLNENISKLVTPKSSKSKKNILISEKSHQQNDIVEELQENVMPCTPLRHKRISELAGPSDRCEFKTPENKTAPDSPLWGDIDELLSDIEPPEIRELIKKGLLAVENHKTPELERLKRLARTPNSANSPATPHGVPEFCTTPEYRKRMLNYLDNRFHLSIKKIKPDTPLAELKKRLWRETLPQEFVETCKYFQDDLNSEESEKQPQPSTSFSSPVTRSLSKTSPTNATPVTSSADRNNIPNDDNENQSPAVKRLKDFLKNCEEERRSSKKIVDNTPLEEETQGVPQRYESEMLFNSERMVGWGDPTEFTLSRRNKINAMQFKGTPIFNISGLQEIEKTEICKRITQLRGQICENLSSYDATCTHIICEKPNRTEKLLSSIAAGKWILYSNYIADCYKEGYFLDEELYEWGNPKAKNLPQLQEPEQTIANVYYGWRQRIFSDSQINGAFTGQKIILSLPNNTLTSLTNVIKAGDGIVLQATSPYDDSVVSQANYCFVDTNRMPLNGTDHQKLIKAGVYVADYLFISKYLTFDPDTDINNFKYKK